ncbi:DNA polymerase III subunit epsilon [Flavobacterium sp.]|uniref:DNA polymerase III subunit epsilon n=1 Tax=Flavobacterium sp. TaxID=239 RepID=UPI00286DE41E|nr:DNA polymerase III subunit epsilon [Flavobacterium sp.]
MEEKPNRYVALAMETTGLDTRKDKMISIGAVGIVNDIILVSDSLEIDIDQDINATTDLEANAIEKLINFIGNATLVGHRIHFEVDMINEVLDKLDCGRLKNDALNIEVMHKKLNDISDKNFSLDELILAYKMQKPERISSANDSFSIALLFLKMKNKLGLI